MKKIEYMMYLKIKRKKKKADSISYIGKNIIWYGGSSIGISYCSVVYFHVRLVIIVFLSKACFNLLTN